MRKENIRETLLRMKQDIVLVFWVNAGRESVGFSFGTEKKNEAQL